MSRLAPRDPGADIRNHSKFDVSGPPSQQRDRGAHLALPRPEADPFQGGARGAAAIVGRAGRTPTFLALAALSRGCTEVRGNGTDDWRFSEEAASSRGCRP